MGDEVPLLVGTVVDGGGQDIASPSGRLASKTMDMVSCERAQRRPLVVTELCLPRSTGTSCTMEVSIQT